MFRFRNNGLTKSIDADTVLVHIDEKGRVPSELDWNSSENNNFYLNQVAMNLGYYILRNSDSKYKQIFVCISRRTKGYRNKLRFIIIKFAIKKYTYRILNRK